jgi:L-alanine-DL-glutamate epimerase-like enolase superfamily enzyme
MDRKQFISLTGLTGFSTLAGGLFNHCSNPVDIENQNGPARIRFEKYKLDLWHDWTITRGTATYKENVFVYYERDGITGVGEAGHMTAAGQDADQTILALDKLIPLYSESPPFQYFDLPEKVNQIMPGPVPAKAALDMALMDWIGKKINLPLYKYFGLNPVSNIKTSFSIGRDTPEIMKQKVKEAAPYHILKIKLTNQNDEEVVQTIRSVTDKPIRVDINEGWTDKENAIRKIEWMSQNGVELIEQPMPVQMLDETAWLKDRSPIPIVADEAVHISSEVVHISEAYDGINIKLMKSGGLVEAYKMCILARVLGLDIMIGCMIESSVAISAAVQLQPFARWLDLDGNLLVRNDPFHGAEFEDGHWNMPKRSGIGVIETKQG